MATKSEVIIKEVLGRMAEEAPPPLDIAELDMPVVNGSRSSRRPSARRRLVAVVASVSIVLATAVVVISRPGVDEVGRVGTLSEATVDELETALLEAFDVLRAADGVEGTQEGYIGGYLASRAWFSSRANGDFAVLEQTAPDVAETAWWLTSSTPPAEGSLILSSASVAVDEVLYRAGTFEPWDVVDPPLGAPSVVVPDDDFVPWEHLLPSSAEVTSQSTTSGGTQWIVATSNPESVQIFLVHPDGYLASWTVEGDPVREPTVQDSPVDFVSVSFAPLESPDPIPVPEVRTPLDLAMFDLPEGFPMAGP